MKFIKKENEYIEIECGDFVYFEDSENTIAQIVASRDGRSEYGIVYLDRGRLSVDYREDFLDELIVELRTNNPNVRFIKNRNIEIKEV